MVTAPGPPRPATPWEPGTELSGSVLLTGEQGRHLRRRRRMDARLTAVARPARSSRARRGSPPASRTATRGGMCGARRRPRVPRPPAGPRTHAARCSCRSRCATRARATAAMAAPRLPAAPPAGTAQAKARRAPPPAHAARPRPRASVRGGSGPCSHESKPQLTPPRSQHPPLKLPQR